MTGINTTMNPGALLLGWPGYTFGLGFLVRPADGNATVQGCAGEFIWAEPKEHLCAVYMTQAPSPLLVGYRRMMKELVSQAMVD